jgi:hypothetical protein
VGQDERRAAQNTFPVPYLQEVRQVGGAGRELADFEFAFWHVFYMCTQVTLGCFEIEVLAFPNTYSLAHPVPLRLASDTPVAS